MTRDGDDEDLGALAPLVRELPRASAPPPDLWKVIAARTGAARPPRASGRFAADAGRSARGSLAQDRGAHRSASTDAGHAAFALAASIAVAAAVAVGLQLGEHNDAGPERAVASVALDDTASDGAGAAIDFGWVLGTPAVAGDIAANLSGELALGARRQRLSIEPAVIAKEPDNIDLRELWAFTYETELQLADACGRTVMQNQRDRG